MAPPKNSHTGKIVLCVVLVLAVIGWMVWNGRERAAYEAQNSGPYERGRTLLWAGRYDEAWDALSTVDQAYRDTEQLRCLSRVGELLESGAGYAAYLESMSLHLDRTQLTDEEARKFDAIMDRVSAAREEHLEQRWEELNEDNREAHEKYGNEPPCVGMQEKYLSYTTWGYTDEKTTKEKTHENGTPYEEVRYNYYDENHSLLGYVICVDGWVQQVVDYTKPSDSKSTGTFEPDDASDDEYDVSKYHNEDDFYDAHYDDFFSYEDAERYYYEHTR